MVPLPRRQVVQSGAALALPLALAGALPITAYAEAPAAAETLSGTMLGWVSVAQRGATLRLVQLDQAGTNRRLAAPVRLEDADSLAGICAAAHRAMLRTVADVWGVEPARCAMGGDRIKYGWRSIRYSFWVDWV